MDDLENEIRKMTGKYDGRDRSVDSHVKIIIEICEHYASELKLGSVDVFKALETKRNYSYPNYYQWSNFPKLHEVEKFKNQKDLKSKIDISEGFRCPSCKGISKDPYTCNTNIKKKGKVCDWKSYGVFRTLGEGLRIVLTDDFLKEPIVDEIFFPVCMEDKCG